MQPILPSAQLLDGDGDGNDNQQQQQQPITPSRPTTTTTSTDNENTHPHSSHHQTPTSARSRKSNDSNSSSAKSAYSYPSEDSPVVRSSPNIQNQANNNQQRRYNQTHRGELGNIIRRFPTSPSSIISSNQSSGGGRRIYPRPSPSLTNRNHHNNITTTSNSSSNLSSTGVGGDDESITHTPARRFVDGDTISVEGTPSMNITSNTNSNNNRNPPPPRRHHRAAIQDLMSTSSNNFPPSPSTNINLPSEIGGVGVGAGATTSIGDDNDDYMELYGTDVNIDDAKYFFRDFLENFKPNYSDNGGLSYDDDDEPHYMKNLSRIYDLQQDFNLNIDCQWLESFNKDCKRWYEQLIKYPAEMIPIADYVVHELFTQQFGNPETGTSILDELDQRIQVRFFNLKERKRMRELEPHDIDRLVCISGMILRVSSIIPDMKQAMFKCAICDHEEIVFNESGKVREPIRCGGNCKYRATMQIVHNRCLFADKQIIKLQETPDNTPEGETPHTVTLLAYDSLVDVCKPGDRVLVTGILKAAPIRIDPRKRTLRSVYNLHLDVLHVSKTSVGRMKNNTSQGTNSNQDNAAGTEFSRDFDETDAITRIEMEKRQRFEEMASMPDIYDLLAKSLAPSIWEMQDVKKGILLQLLGGTNKDAVIATGTNTNNNDLNNRVGLSASLHRGRARGEINILLCGDPGTSKSQLLGFVHRVAPRGIYTSGKGSSAVGLTAYVTKDPDTKEIILESGALVLSDRGVCCIDEFDKMNDSTRAILHEVMEQQTISLAKSGIICTLNARTSILASANPVSSRYDPNMSVVQNIQLPPTLLSRFDLIYLVLDKTDPKTDRALARHLVQMYQSTGINNNTTTTTSSGGGSELDVDEFENRPPFTLQELAGFISYAREKCYPKIDPDSQAKRKLISSYVDMRKLGNLGGSGKKTISATPRQLESIIRLAEARAKTRLSSVVSEDDVTEAVRLMHVATHRAAMDPRTGTIDMDAIATGRTALERLIEDQLSSACMEFLRDQYRSGDRVMVDTILNALNEQASVPVVREQLIDTFVNLQRENVLKWVPSEGVVRVL
jgi:DNA replication licensing factor MCM4